MLQPIIIILWAFYGFIDRTASEMTGNSVRERGVVHSKGPHMVQSLLTYRLSTSRVNLILFVRSLVGLVEV